MSEILDKSESDVFDNDRRAYGVWNAVGGDVNGLFILFLGFALLFGVCGGDSLFSLFLYFFSFQHNSKVTGY